MTIGAWATKTNVSAAQFGEGSFDKGIYVSIPFDALLPRSSKFTANFAWAPLVRDGGAKLGRINPLFEMTSIRDPKAFSFSPPDDKAPKAGTTSSTSSGRSRRRQRAAKSPDRGSWSQQHPAEPGRENE